jgi:hypothetical protein
MRHIVPDAFASRNFRHPDEAAITQKNGALQWNQTCNPKYETCNPKSET